MSVKTSRRSNRSMDTKGELLLFGLGKNEPPGKWIRLPIENEDRSNGYFYYLAVTAMHMHIDVINTPGGWQPQLTFESSWQTVFGRKYKSLEEAKIEGLRLAMYQAQKALAQIVSHRSAQMASKSSTRTRK